MVRKRIRKQTAKKSAKTVKYVRQIWFDCWWCLNVHRLLRIWITGMQHTACYIMALLFLKLRTLCGSDFQNLRFKQTKRPFMFRHDGSFDFADFPRFIRAWKSSSNWYFGIHSTSSALASWNDFKIKNSYLQS